MPIELILFLYLLPCFAVFFGVVFGMLNARNDRLSMIANAYVTVLVESGGKQIPSVGVRAVLEVIKKIHEENEENEERSDNS